jgi:hypothetical protein
MRVAILDAETLRAISPVALAGYARGEGWTKAETYGAHADVYTAAGKPEIILPRTDRLGDYPSTVAKLINIFANVAQQDELATYRDLSGADRDVVSIRAFGGDDDGSVLIDSGVEIVAQARQLVLAAACAARTPQSIYRAGANREAIDYLHRVRLGQTGQGSFVVNLLAPIPPQLQPLEQASWPNFDDEPFERQVTRRLAQALDALRGAVDLAASGDGQGAFERAVTNGVSANLCEAVAGLIAQSSGIDINLRWARTRPTPETHRRTTFSGNDADIVTEAARTLRARHPRPDVSLVGTVSRLKRDNDEVEGLVTLRAIVDEKPQSVRAVLDQVNYSVAVQAHDSKTPVFVKGDLERVGQRWQLINAQVTSLLQVGSGEDDMTT